MGTEEFWVPAVVAAVGAAGGAVNQKQAANRQDASEAQAIMDQQKIQQQATGAAGNTIAKIAQSNPNQLAAAATGEYVKQLRTNAAGTAQGGTGSALAPAVGGSSRYKGDVAAAQTGVNQFGDKYAGQMGQIDAATRQRQNEGLDMQDLGTKLNTLNAQSFSTNFVDQLRAQVSGTPNPYVGLASNLLQNGARNWMGSSKAPKKTTGTPTSLASLGIDSGSDTGPTGYTINLPTGR